MKTLKHTGVSIYEVNRNVVCLECGHRGAIQSYGKLYEDGLGDKVDEFGPMVKQIMEKHRNSMYISHTMGFGGTMPWNCTNCGNEGLIDFGGLEGYKQAFKTKFEWRDKRDD